MWRKGDSPTRLMGNCTGIATYAEEYGGSLIKHGTTVWEDLLKSHHLSPWSSALGRIDFYSVPPWCLMRTSVTALARLGYNCFSPCLVPLLAQLHEIRDKDLALYIQAEQWSRSIAGTWLLSDGMKATQLISSLYLCVCVFMREGGMGEKTSFQRYLLYWQGKSEGRALWTE